ncbi:hypothetical protein BCV71DRAFT_238924 [Rhizopus microsporus]|uniref:Uncharacterized protein n=1 Tax=Rhizopus microsporus TaxID=58291 RepID=A0A1X0RPB2_RHIZD|nr:hypothetical protein BCV71DRAFT_238924 [Rhizopus microsporus]
MAISEKYLATNTAKTSNCFLTAVDQSLWILYSGCPFSKSECSRCIRRRLGWLPGGKPRPCPKHLNQQLSKNHIISCLDMHRRLFMPDTIRGPLSFLLSMLSLRPSVPPNLALS